MTTMKFAAWTLLLVGAAHATPRRIAVLELETRGPIDDAAAATFHAAVQEGVEAGGDKLLPANLWSAALAKQPELARCTEEECLRALSAATAAEGVVAAEIGKQPVHGEHDRAQYQVRLQFLATGRTTALEEERCGRCRETELATLLTILTRRLLQNAAVPLLPSPPFAKPIDRLIVRPAPAPLLRRPLVIGLAATGAALVVVGASLLALDGHGTCAEANSEVHCPERYNTAAGGGVSLAAGLAAIAGSATLWFWRANF